MTQKTDEEVLHKAPCPWMQVMIWAFGVIMLIGGVAIGHVMSRLALVESRVNEDHTLMIETSTELKYIKVGVDKLSTQLDKNQEIYLKNTADAATAAADAATAAAVAAAAAANVATAILNRKTQ